MQLISRVELETYGIFPLISGAKYSRTRYSEIMKNHVDDRPPRQPRRGFLNPEVVRGISFWTASACVLVAVVSCLLAIWQFTGTDALWRTVATCAVIGGGTIA